ncbi:chromosomal replication initiator protein DnaA [Paraburkholderia sp. SARCC-3016]|uniref:chromosomal replication initiator protein DnaA n=1 Tax=Paraburkholderia sp. SARCC-3016 TaxID=3058611 RepID=UPI002809674D|nr:chromosomal replication initiator protein DnaA [Paraburkholderia sp. SARCC-3016]MDQ7982464.1 chromosomal replication initiator protein DnaA [Paraburkholderia sp. SARCC-3016]
MNEFWQHCSALLERELTPQQYVTWIKPLAPVSFDADANTLSIAAPNRFKLDWVKSQFSGRITDLARDFWHTPVDVQFVLDPKASMRGIPQAAQVRPSASALNGGAAAVDAAVSAVQAAQAARAGASGFGGGVTAGSMSAVNGALSAAAQHAHAIHHSSHQSADDSADLDLPSLDANEAAAARRTWRPPQGAAAASSSDATDSMYERSKLNPVLTFDNFVTGKANQLARAAAIQVADNPGVSYNPLFLYGGVGLGKTHLIHAIGNQLLMDKAGARIRYIHAEQYVSDVVKAYQRKAFDDFKRYYHSLDLLLIDDIQFFSGKSRTQEEFFYAFEALVANKAQVIITSDTYPKEISGIDDRLISRFDSGLTVAIEPPELEMRVAILMRKAQSEGVSLSEDVAFFVAKHLRSNVRELEGALRKILAYSKFHGREISIELTKEALKDLLTVQNRQISVENIQKTVADFYSIKVADMYSKKRPANIARPRQIAMYLAKELTQKSLPEIGELFGGRDHTTVLHAVRKIADERGKDAQLNHELHVLEQTLKG